MGFYLIAMYLRHYSAVGLGFGGQLQEGMNVPVPKWQCCLYMLYQIYRETILVMGSGNCAL